MRGAAGRSLFAVGEYFTGSVATLRWFIEQTGQRLSLYDFPLHFNMRDLGRGSSNIDMRHVFDGALVAQDPVLAVTFVDNHDTWHRMLAVTGGRHVVPGARLRADPAARERLAGHAPPSVELCP